MAPFKKQGHSDQEKAAYAHLVQNMDSDVGSIEDSGMDLDHPSTTQKPNALKTTLAIAAKVVCVVLALWGLASLVRIPMSAKHLPPRFEPDISTSCSCGGTTVAEAMSRGCIFTPLSLSWLPPHCIDQELSDEFDRSGPGPDGAWEYWADRHRKVPLNRTEMGLLADNDGVFFATQEWHITHCTFTWRKHYRQKWTGVTVERRSNGLDHIGHCEDVFKVRGPLQDIMTIAGVALNADEVGETM
jgi:hypothetical protein